LELALRATLLATLNLSGTLGEVSRRDDAERALTDILEPLAGPEVLFNRPALRVRREASRKLTMTRWIPQSL
jgi:hypothetical protein